MWLGAATFIQQGADAFAAHELFQFRPVLPEYRLSLYAVLQAFEIGFQFGRWRIGEGVYHPLLIAPGGNHVAFAQVGEMLRDNHLRFSQYLLQMTDAER